jgi:hypothetical protein
LVSVLCLNLPIQTSGRFAFGVIVPIPPHTQNISGNNKKGNQMKKKLIFVSLFFVILIISCEKKTTEPENWDPYGSYSGVIEDNGNGSNFEQFVILSSGINAHCVISYIEGLFIYEETIYISGDLTQDGDNYLLSGNFSVSIEDNNGSLIYTSNGSITGELHYDDDMPFPEGTGSGSTVDNQRTISWSIFKSQ